LKAKYVIAVLFFTCVATAVYGQQSESVGNIVTDRPGFTATAVVVPRGHVQIESGFSWLWESGGAENFTIPEMVIRWTFVDRVEFRLGVPNYVDTQNHVNESGFGDSAVGAKFQFGPVGEWSLAGLVTLWLPTGEDLFTSDAVDPSLVAAAGRNLGDTWSIGGQLSADWISETDDRSFILSGTLVLGKSVGESWGGFIETGVWVPEGISTDVQFQVGGTYLMTPNVQLDLRGGVGATDTAPDHFVGAGVSARIPTG
jgi:hypothetical protein